jgi:CRP/FNR family transcriptional regulator
MPVELETIRSLPLFRGLGPADLARVAALMVERHYARGDILLLEGTAGGALHYLRSGVVKIYKTSPDGREQVLRLSTAGDTFNEVPALDGGPNPASAAAVEASVVYVLERAELHRLLLTRPEVADAVIRGMAAALRHLVSVIETLSFHHVTSRVAKILLEQEESLRAGHATHRLTQQEMAAIAGTAREMVGRALKQLEAAGAIAMRQGHPVVRDAERLRLLAQ